MHNILQTIAFLILFSGISFGFEFKNLAVQDSGRIKPLDSMARDALVLLTGKKVFEGKDPSQTILSWLVTPELWTKKIFIEVRNFELKSKLKLDSDRSTFSYSEISSASDLSNVFQELNDRKKSNPKLDPYFQAVQRLNNQLSLFVAIAKGDYLPVMPVADKNGAWKSPSQFSDDENRLFAKLFSSEIKKLSLEKSSDFYNNSAAIELYTTLKSKFPEQYPDNYILELEVGYNEYHLFKLAWLLYILAAVLTVVISQSVGARWTQFIRPKVLVLLGLVLHTIGFAIRMYILKRPPVSNMYETVIWVSWGAIVFSLLIEKIYRFKYVAMMGSILGALALIVADSAPTILDSGLHPLEPVLKSNLWLTIHVMVITISYSAFFLALGLGHLAMVQYLRPPAFRSKESLEILANAIYRAIQFGVVLLAPGIILGGIWADYSWGRFWGWDPKETWALIVLLGYLAIVHGRLVGWLRSFGISVVAVIAFNLVIMAWYGVNYVLGAGLHTYGFGAGGVEYIAAFVALEILFVSYVIVIRQAEKQVAI